MKDKLLKAFDFSFLSFFRYNVSGGMVLIIMSILAMVLANSPWSNLYLEIWNRPISLQIGTFNLFSHHGSPLTLMSFINDALMAVFFFFVGLEIKREILVGHLSSMKQALLPIVAAAGGIVIPVIFYLFLCPARPLSTGFAIPMATDIAFSLGVMSLLGKRVPLSLKIFLTAFAVVDDIAGILVIAVFYSKNLEFIYLLWALGIVAVLFTLNYLHVVRKTFYVLLGIFVWYLFLQSGIHSTIAGVLIAFTIPAHPRLQIGKYVGRIRRSIQKFPYSDKKESIVLSGEQICELKNIEAASNKVISPLQFMEDRLHGVVNFFIMPLFAFANAGVSFGGESGEIFGIVTLAVAFGLFFGKSIGIFTFSWLAVKTKLVSLPDDVNWMNILGVAFLGGIGFTVSLFIANLSFGAHYPEYLNQAKLGIIIGTLISSVTGLIVLRISTRKKRNQAYKSPSIGTSIH